MNDRKPYRPSNGDEGRGFVARFCDECHHDRNQSCEILAKMYSMDVSEKSYPKELVHDDDGYGTCTKFLERGSDEARSYEARVHAAKLEDAGQGSLF